MRTRAALGLVVVATLTALGVHSSAEPLPVPPACVVVDQEPVRVQLGYAPNGPEDCSTLP